MFFFFFFFSYSLYDNFLYYQTSFRQYTVKKGENIEFVVGDFLFFIDNPELLEENNSFVFQESKSQLSTESPGAISYSYLYQEDKSGHFYAVAKEDGILSIYLLSGYFSGYTNIIIKRGRSQKIVFAGNKTNYYLNSDIQLRNDMHTSLACIFSNIDVDFKVSLKYSYYSSYSLYTPSNNYIDISSSFSYENSFIIKNEKMICLSARSSDNSNSDYFIIEEIEEEDKEQDKLSIFNAIMPKITTKNSDSSSTTGKIFSCLPSISLVIHESLLVSSHGFHVIENVSYPLTFYSLPKTLLIFHDNQIVSGYFFDNETKYTIIEGPQDLHYSAVLFHYINDKITEKQIKVITTGKSRIDYPNGMFYVFASPHYHQFISTIYLSLNYVPLDYESDTLTIDVSKRYNKIRTALFSSFYTNTIQIYPISPFSCDKFINGELQYSETTKTYQASQYNQLTDFYIGNDDSHSFIPKSTVLSFTALTNSYIVFHTKTGFTASYNGKTLDMNNTFGFNVIKNGIVTLTVQESKTIYWSSIIEKTDYCDSFHIAIGENIHYGIGPKSKSYRYIINATYEDQKELCAWLVTPEIRPQSYTEGYYDVSIKTMDGLLKHFYSPANAVHEGSIFINFKQSFYSTPSYLLLYLLHTYKNVIENQTNSLNNEFVNAKLKRDGDFLSLADNDELPAFWDSDSSSYVGVSIIIFIDVLIILWIFYYYFIRPRKMKPPVISEPLNEPLLAPEELHLQLQTPYSQDIDISNPYSEVSK